MTDQTLKALSFRQPWAELILRGRKTLDLRTYTTAHRGLLVIHASQTVERDACAHFDLDPDQLPAGGLVGLVELIDVQPLSAEAYAARADEHLSGRSYRQTLYGWSLANPQRLPALIPAGGRPRLFTVTLPAAALDATATPTAPATAAAAPPATAPTTVPTTAPQHATAARPAPPNTPFALLVVPENGHAYALRLEQRLVQKETQTYRYGEDSAELTPIVTLSGDNLRAVAAHVLSALRDADYKATDLAPTRRRPFWLPEPIGVRLGLLMLAVKPLSKFNRIEAIAYGIGRMPAEEAYYWYSKCTAQDSADRAQRALRVLLAAE